MCVLCGEKAATCTAVERGGFDGGVETEDVVAAANIFVQMKTAGLEAAQAWAIHHIASYFPADWLKYPYVQ